MPSCFSGGRRMVKWTRSTDGSDFRRLRQARSPACGSPDTSSTRSRSRTPLTTKAARLLSSVSSLRAGLDLDLDHVGPTVIDWRRSTGRAAADRHGEGLGRAAVLAHGDAGPGRADPGSASSGKSSIRSLTATSLPTTPKLGACASQPPVALVWLAGDQRMERRAEGEARAGRHVVHLAVGQQDHAGQPFRRHLDKGRARRTGASRRRRRRAAAAGATASRTSRSRAARALLQRRARPGAWRRSPIR